MICFVRLKNLREKRRIFYKQIVSIFCPILNESVYFTSEGFNHLLYERHKKPRSISEQYMKLQCLVYVPDVIKNCMRITDTRLVLRNIKGKLKKAKHFELVYEVSTGAKIRVIIEKVGTGKHKFKSVMPHNKRSQRKLASKKHP